jgi:glycosyltransferase involved in cell wall biosynthesis
MTKLLSQIPNDWEILVGDNNSEDDTWKVLDAFPKVVRFHRAMNIGALGNILDLYGRATQPYITYLGDDDELIVEKVRAYLEMLESTKAAAVYAPWELWNEVNEKSMGQFYRVNDGEDLYTLVMKAGMLPEIAIYRRDLMKTELKQSRNADWNFVTLAHLLHHQQIILGRTPFYRSTVYHTLDASNPRQQQGTYQALFQLDRLRAGVEYLAGSQGWCGDKFQLDLAQMMAERMKVARRIWIDKGDLVAVREMSIRLKAYETC